MAQFKATKPKSYHLQLRHYRLCRSVVHQFRRCQAVSTHPDSSDAESSAPLGRQREMLPPRATERRDLSVARSVRGCSLGARQSGREVARPDIRGTERKSIVSASPLCWLSGPRGGEEAAPSPARPGQRRSCPDASHPVISSLSYASCSAIAPVIMPSHRRQSWTVVVFSSQRSRNRGVPDPGQACRGTPLCVFVQCSAELCTVHCAGHSEDSLPAPVKPVSWRTPDGQEAGRR